MKRTTAIVAALVGLVVLAPAALADDSSSDTSATETTTPATTTEVVTETPAATTEVVTETPTTTDVPATTTVTETPETTVTTTVPTTTGIEACVEDCIPTDTATCAECIPDTGNAIPNAVAGTGVGTAYGAGNLPFTGVEDTIAAVLLALVVVLGGVVAWRWAQLENRLPSTRAALERCRQRRSAPATATRSAAR